MIEYEERIYDNLLILSPSATFMGALKMGQMIDFVNLGGNILLAGSENISEALKDFSYEFSVDFGSSPVRDYFHTVEESIFSTSKLVGSSYIVSDLKGPIVYSGIGHAISGKNVLVQPLLVGEDSAIAADTKKVTEKSLIGSKVNLVSTFQALNNARVVFCGSVDMFSNKYFLLI